MSEASGGKIAGFKLTDNTEKYNKIMEEALESALHTIGLKAEGYAKRELNGDFGAPKRIDTSNLRNSVNYSVQMEETAVYIGTNVEYAPYVHEGTRYMEANRFLRNAAEKHLSEYQQIIKEVLS